MARPLRIEYPGAYYHVSARGNDRKRIFFTKRDYLKFSEYIAGAQDKYGCLLHAYVFMTNHYHMILETPEANISKVMHFLNGSYTNYINKNKKKHGVKKKSMGSSLLLTHVIYDAYSAARGC